MFYICNYTMYSDFYLLLWQGTLKRMSTSVGQSCLLLDGTTPAAKTTDETTVKQP